MSVSFFMFRRKFAAGMDLNATGYDVSEELYKYRGGAVSI
jgi:hypothetical protein